jgi:RimJ/RimL family protein N-acetyltransferase
VKYDFSQDPKYLEIANELIDCGDYGYKVYTIAVFDDDDQFVAVALYNNWVMRSCDIHLATVTPKWATREVIRVMATYPFLELNVNRVTAPIKANNVKAQQFVQRLGFVQEGELKNFYEDGDSNLLFGLTKDKCRWI